MPTFVPSFSITPSISPSSFTITDTSQNGPSGASTRTILLYQSNGTLLVPGINFPINAGAGDSITISPLTQDIALNVVVNYTASNGTVLFSSNVIFAFLQYTLLFLYQLTESQSSTPAITQDTNYYTNKMQLFTEVQSALNAINTGLDLAGAQFCIQRALVFTQNQSLYF
jgi:hypothetical protein